MPAAVRVGDPTGHPGGTVTGPGVPNVLIGGQPAAVVGDLHACGMPPPTAGNGPHPVTGVLNGSPTVLIGGRPAARQGDVAGCGAVLMSVNQTVQIG